MTLVFAVTPTHLFIYAAVVLTNVAEWS